MTVLRLSAALVFRICDWADNGDSNGRDKTLSTQHYGRIYVLADIYVCMC